MIYEEATISSVAPVMGVFNSPVLFHQHEKQNRLDLIEPELAASREWNHDFPRVSFRLRQGVKCRDGKAFTANDVKCTGDMLLGRSSDKLLDPRKAWHRNLDKATIDGITGSVRAGAQPAFLMRLASGMLPVYIIPTLPPSIAGPDPLRRQGRTGDRYPRRLQVTSAIDK